MSSRRTSKQISVNDVICFFTYIISFMSTFRNALIYIIGNKPITRVYYDLFYFIIILVALYLAFFSKRSSNLNNLRYVLPLTIWVFFQSVIISLSTGNISFPRVLLTGLLTTVMLVVCIKSETQLINSILFAAVGLILTALIPLIKYPELIGIRISFYDGIEYVGSFWNNVLISFISVGWISIAIITKEDIGRFQKFILFFGFAISWFASMAGLSRVFLLASFTSLVSLFFSLKGLRPLIITLLSGFFAYIALAYFFPDVLEGILFRFKHLTGGGISEETRVYIWTSFLGNIDKYFWIGATVDFRTLGPLNWYGGPHSGFLNWFVQYGIVGFLFFLYFVFGTFKKLFKVRKTEPMAYALLLSGFIAYLTLISVNETGFYEPSFYTGFGFVFSWISGIGQ